jgi:hypothetical protein
MPKPAKALPRPVPEFSCQSQPKPCLGLLYQYAPTLTDDGTIAQVFHAGVFALITGIKPIHAATCPETFLLDVGRLAAMHANFGLHVLVASVLVIVGQRLQELHVKNLSQTLDSIAEQIFASKLHATNITEVVRIASSKIETSCEISDIDRAKLGAVLVKGTQVGCPVPKLMSSRLKKVFVGSLDYDAGDLFKNVNTIQDTFTEYQLPLSLRVMAPHLRDDCHRLGKIVSLNCKELQLAHRHGSPWSHSVACPTQWRHVGPDRLSSHDSG